MKGLSKAAHTFAGRVEAVEVDLVLRARPPLPLQAALLAQDVLEGDLVAERRRELQRRQRAALGGLGQLELGVGVVLRHEEVVHVPPAIGHDGVDGVVAGLVAEVAVQRDVLRLEHLGHGALEAEAAGVGEGGAAVPIHRRVLKEDTHRLVVEEGGEALGAQHPLAEVEHLQEQVLALVHGRHMQRRLSVEELQPERRRRVRLLEESGVGLHQRPDDAERLLRVAHEQGVDRVRSDLVRRIEHGCRCIDLHIRARIGREEKE
eukprot:scaffold88107_cov67-Phaeocystis_antarctica.AAC.1